MKEVVVVSAEHAMLAFCFAFPFFLFSKTSLEVNTLGIFALIMLVGGITGGIKSKQYGTN